MKTKVRMNQGRVSTGSETVWPVGADSPSAAVETASTHVHGHILSKGRRGHLFWGVFRCGGCRWMRGAALRSS